MSTEEVRNRVFNKGCDARLAGLPVNANTYTNKALGDHWEAGWMHVDATWGRLAKWRYKPLPAVKETA